MATSIRLIYMSTFTEFRNTESVSSMAEDVSAHVERTTDIEGDYVLTVPIPLLHVHEFLSHSKVVNIPLVGIFPATRLEESFYDDLFRS